MKITREKAGAYILTGHMAGLLVQYKIEKMASWWTVEKIYGSGPDFGRLYATLREASDSIIAYSDN